MPDIMVSHKGDMLFEARTGDHIMEIDVPASVGGKNRAATPLDVFAMSLASCIGAMAVIFCKNSNMETAGITVKMTCDKLSNPARLTNFRATLDVPGGVPETRREPLLRTARLCPVHATMKHAEGVEIKLA